MKQIIAYVLVLAALMAGCRSAAQNKDAVRKGVIDYLSKRSDMMVSSMDIDVVSVSFRKNEADAVVSFKPKGSAEGGMQMNYTLENKNGNWTVKGRKEGGASPHGAAGGMMPPGGQPQGGQLPPGHPTVQPPESSGKAK